ncbi:MAG: septum formation initiator family protein [Lachnospiraceae bacterium]|nr:septum formation initiator family protein [Lachnospiraceae bacterium]
MSRRNTIKSENRKGMLVVIVVLMVLCAALFLRYRNLKAQYQDNADTIAVLEERRDEELQRTQRLQQQEAYQQTDAFVEETARRLLNLVKPGDTTIKPNVEE